MKFKARSKLKRLQQRLEENSKWKVVFAWWPTRIDSNTVVWMECLSRRWLGKTQDIVFGIKRPIYMYGPRTHALTQPGVGINAPFVNAQQPSAGVFQQLDSISNAVLSNAVLSIGGGVPGQQTSGVAVQSGPSHAAQNAMQAVLLQGKTHACAPPQGGLNSPPPQPRP